MITHKKLNVEKKQGLVFAAQLAGKEDYGAAIIPFTAKEIEKIGEENIKVIVARSLAAVNELITNAEKDGKICANT